MAKRLKLTGFARFFILLVILAPLSYLIASYANGEDGMENIKRLVGITDQVEQPATSKNQGETAIVSKAQRIATLEQEIAVLQDSLEAKDLEIAEMKRQIRLLKGSR
ncbi:MAG: hypothetical protein IPH16_07665 [Haliscomenobacter sp.]|nr:hypothetical protein [Haliscomenobacter sp.]MBK7475829.1 hypothetical protein [Haliscomenobacter sp.]MBK8879263.1 hypothetical protein [Haliscomenobacter sp.]